MKYITTFLIFVLSTMIAFGNNGHKVEIEVENYDRDTIVIGNFYGEKQIVKDTLSEVAEGKYILEGEEALPPGMYLILFLPENMYIQFLVNAEDQEFKVLVDKNELAKIKFEGSDDNQLFYDYLDYLTERREQSEALKAKIQSVKEAGGQDIEAEQELEKLDKEVKAYQRELIQKNPGKLTTLLLQSSQNTDIPEFEGTEKEIQFKRYLFYRKHYFDHIDPANPVNLRMPYLHERISYYVNKLTPQHPDSIIIAVDSILNWVEPAEETFKYYLSYFLNTYAKGKIVGFDAIYVHLVDHYYSKDKAPWVEEEQLTKIIDNANRIRPVLIGTKAQDLDLYYEDGTPFNLYDFEAEYTVLLFWAPECSHCKKAIPYYLKFEEKFKEKGVKLITICTKGGKKYPDCWKDVKDKGMENLRNLGDQYLRSRFKSKYDVRATPKVFILDKDKEIIMKDIPAENIEQVMDDIIKFRQKERAEQR